MRNLALPIPIQTAISSAFFSVVQYLENSYTREKVASKLLRGVCCVSKSLKSTLDCSYAFLEGYIIEIQFVVESSLHCGSGLGKNLSVCISVPHTMAQSPVVLSIVGRETY